VLFSWVWLGLKPKLSTYSVWNSRGVEAVESDGFGQSFLVVVAAGARCDVFAKDVIAHQFIAVFISESVEVANVNGIGGMDC
jgi:hypothetical protein